MEYFIAFLEGIITFISPCLLPLLPVYISFFVGQEQNTSRLKTFSHALGFVLGFSLIFVTLGAFAGTIGRFLHTHQQVVNIITGSIVILFGLNFMELIHISFISGHKGIKAKLPPINFLSTVLFGMIFAISWTPCVGAFLGSALMLAAHGGESMKGILMLLAFSLGLGIPFLISAILIDSLKSTFDWIKSHYHMITFVSGLFLVLIGLLMTTGFMNYFLSLLTF